MSACLFHRPSDPGGGRSRLCSALLHLVRRLNVIIIYWADEINYYLGGGGGNQTSSETKIIDTHI